MTRSISLSLPMTGSSFPARAASVRLMPSWSTVGRLAGALRLGRRAGRRALRQDADDLVADLVEVHAERLEHAGGDALTLADEAEQQMLRADVVVSEPAGFVDGELDDALRARRQADLADDRPIAAADDELDRRPDLRQLDVHVLEHARCDALALADEPKQQVLRTDVVVVEPLRFVLGKCQDFAGAISEFVEAIHSSRTPVPLRASRMCRSGHASTTSPTGTPCDERWVSRPYERFAKAFWMPSASVRNRNDPPCLRRVVGKPVRTVNPACSPPSSRRRSP